MRILITGVTGFVGSHLADALTARNGVELFGIARRGAWTEDCRHLEGRVLVRACDLADAAAVDSVLQETQPEQIYHLAGYPHVGRSLNEPAAAWAGNLTATLHFYDAVCRWGGKPRILHVSSGMIYGEASAPSGALDESSPLQPATPYAASKAAADLAAFQYHVAACLEIVRVRPFNQIGPRQSPDFALSSFARQITAIASHRKPPVIETGDLTPRRDLTDVRDMVEAYVSLMERGRPGEAYNAGSGEVHSMQTVLARLLALAGITPEIHSRVRELRQADPAVLRADCGKLKQDTGWTRKYSLDQTLNDILGYWRTRT